MKKLLISIAFVAVAAGLGVATARHYQTYKRAQDAKAAQAAAIVAADKAEQEKRYMTVRNAYDKENQECLKGKAAWESLTPAAKPTKVQPVCGALAQ